MIEKILTDSLSNSVFHLADISIGNTNSRRFVSLQLFHQNPLSFFFLFGLVLVIDILFITFSRGAGWPSG